MNTIPTSPAVISPVKGRIADRFDELKAAGRAGLVTFITAGDPDLETSFQILRHLPEAGADLIELGMPFSDPMADGPAIQLANGRALKAGMRLPRLLDMVRRFRAEDAKTPIILMGYYNPIYQYGSQRFVEAAKTAGVDGLIVVDLPPEEDAELCLPARATGLDFIRLVAPTTGEARLPVILRHASGFVYYVSIAGITGTRAAGIGTIRKGVADIRRHSQLPIAVGFGIKTPEQAQEIGAIADSVVVGSAIIDGMVKSWGAGSADGSEVIAAVGGYVRSLALALGNKTV